MSVTETRLDDVIGKLGGKPFLVSVARRHRSYGEAVHITGPRDGDTAASDPDAAVRRSLDVLLEPLLLRAGGTDTCDSVDDDTIAGVYSWRLTIGAERAARWPRQRLFRCRSSFRQRFMAAFLPRFSRDPRTGLEPRA